MGRNGRTISPGLPRRTPAGSPPPSARRGTALIVSLGVLVVLAMLATVFATMAGVERDISRNYVDLVRARFLAESGIHESVAELCRDMTQTVSEDRNRNGALDPGEDVNGNGVLDGAGPDGVPWPAQTAWWYRGEDYNDNGVLDGAAEDQDQLPSAGTLDTASCPAGDARYPSLSDYSAGLPRTIFLDINGAPRPRGVSRALAAGSYGRNCDLYAVKIVDTSAQIYINDFNPNLPRILNNLGRQVVPVIANLGNRICGLNAAGNPVAGTGRFKVPYHQFVSKDELVQFGILTAAELEQVRDFITVHAWVDPKVVNPVPLSAFEHNGGPGTSNAYLVREGSAYNQYYRPNLGASGVLPAGKGYRYGPGWSYNYNDITGSMNTPIARRPYHQFATVASSALTNPNAFVYGYDELNPQWIEVASRAPVNINTASREVLTALIEGLDGFYMVERNRPPVVPPASNTSGYRPWAYTQDIFGNQGGSTARNVFGSGSFELIGSRGSEIGILYRTGPVRGPAGTSAGGATGRLAGVLADRIIQFRSGRNILPGGSNLPDVKEGPFTSWAQFDAFLDQLLLQDNAAGGVRDLLLNAQEGNPFLWPAAFPERYVHAQAKLDVLKANFNPNLHLNELNPDAALWTWVDKTDLVVASTEFCFQPMGIFEIESCGRVIQPSVPQGDLFAAGVNGAIVAEKVIRATVKLYGAARQGTQREFAGGDPALPPLGSTWIDELDAPPSAAPDPVRTGMTYIRTPAKPQRTGNMMVLSLGPEPDNGNAPFDNDYEGYMSLALMGGYRYDDPPGPNIPGGPVPPVVPLIPPTSPKAKRYVYTQLPRGNGAPSTRYPSLAIGMDGSGGPPTLWGEGIHSHFDFDFNACYSRTQDTDFTWAGGPTWLGERRVHFARRHDRCLSSGGDPNQALAKQWFNYPDPSETWPADVNDPNSRRHVRGPYCLADRYDGPLGASFDSLGDPRREYRCGRSFRVSRVPPANPAASAAVTASATSLGPPPWFYYAPSDLRNDGGYFERHACPLWSPTNDQHSAPPHAPVNIYTGVAAFWVKPGFSPEIAGKQRCLFSMSRPHGGNPAVDGPGGWNFLNPTPFALYFTPNHSSSFAGVPVYVGADSNGAAANGYQLRDARPRSFLFGFGFGPNSGYDLGEGRDNRPGDGIGCEPKVAGVTSNSLNRIVTSGDYNLNRYRATMLQTPRPLLDGHQWAHVVLMWRLRNVNSTSAALQVWVNGVLQSVGPFRDPNRAAWPANPKRILEIGSNPPGSMDWDGSVWQEWHSYTWWWDTSVGEPYRTGFPPPPNAAPALSGRVAPLRLGEPTNIVPSREAGQNVSRNFAADMTFDEFFVWTDQDPGGWGGGTQGPAYYTRGRYYRGNNAIYLSRRIDLQPSAARRVLVPPVGSTPAAPLTRNPEILGVAWTIRTKGFDVGRAPTAASPGLGQHRIFDGQTNRYLDTGVMVQVSGAGGPPYYGRAGSAQWMTDCRWSTPYRNGAQSQSVTLNPALPTLRYRANFQTSGVLAASSILMESPFLDDVTFFVSTGAAVILEWMEL